MGQPKSKLTDDIHKSPNVTAFESGGGTQNILSADRAMEGEQKPVKVIVVGAGERGHGYASYAIHYPNKLKVVGVCEPREFHRNEEIRKHNIPVENAFSDWTDAVQREKFADCVFICTPDRLHKGPAIAFAKKGYHLLVEKPLAVTAEDCKEIVETCKANNVLLSVCHVLRYTPWVQKVKEIIDSGRIGEVVNISHTEPVGYWHFAHSYVRGNWHKEADSTFSLLAKCCHDIDLICHWMEGKRCNSVSSFGSLSHFHKRDKVGYWHFAHAFVRGNWRCEDESTFSLLTKCCHDIDLICHWMEGKLCERVSSFGHLSHFHKSDKPEGAASRCIDCPKQIESKCPFSAKEFYIGMLKQGNTGWPVSVITDIVDIENVTEALRKGPYGKCVYDTDNDVMSQQVVTMQFEGGATASLTMVAFTEKVCCRETKFYGTKGQMVVEDGWNAKIEVFDFLSETRSNEKCVEHPRIPDSLMGHGGADFHTVNSFVDTLMNPTENKIQTGPDNTLASHLLTFAAERARKENRVLTRDAQGQYV